MRNEKTPFSTRLTELRESYNLSKTQLADLIGFGHTIVYYWEEAKREPNLQALLALSKFFKCSVDYLIGLSDDFGNVTVTGEELSQEEKDLIKCYRALDFDARNVIRIQLKALVESKV